jgi:Mn2+/Fe2+ NRAMP family transporter
MVVNEEKIARVMRWYAIAGIRLRKKRRTLLPTHGLPMVVAIVNGIAAAPFLIVVMIISRNRALMGASRNRALAEILGWGTVALMTAAALAMLALLSGL